MKLPFSPLSIRPVFVGVLLVPLALFAPLSAGAQRAEAHNHAAGQGPDRQYVPETFTTADVDGAAPSKSKSAPKPAVSQEQLADAILADSMRRVWDQTDAHFHKGEYRHIVNLSRINVQADPKNVEAYSNSAWLLWSTDREEEGIAFLRQGIKAAPSIYYLYDELGRHYAGISVKNYKAAIPLLEKAVTFQCPFFTWHTLAYCYEKTNQWEKAVRAWESAAKYPNNPVPVAEKLKRARARLAQYNGKG